MLTYKPSASGRLLAAYSSQCRIGYIELRAHGRWRWQLSLVAPRGGYPTGVADDMQEAKETLLAHYQHWITSAGLTPQEKWK